MIIAYLSMVLLKMFITSIILFIIFFSVHNDFTMMYEENVVKEAIEVLHPKLVFLEWASKRLRNLPKQLIFVAEVMWIKKLIYCELWIPVTKHWKLAVLDIVFLVASKVMTEIPYKKKFHFQKQTKVLQITELLLETNARTQ